MKTRTITGLAILTALTIVLQIIGNFVPMGPVSITLALIPVAVGAMMYGPLAGAFLGLVMGSMTLFAPSTLAVFMPVSVGGTIATCLVKTTLAGLIVGFIFKLLYKKNFLLAVILTSVLLPILNTGFFVGFAFLFFISVMQDLAQKAGVVDWVSFFFLVMIGWNFLLELTINSALSPALYRLLKSKQFEKYF